MKHLALIEDDTILAKRLVAFLNRIDDFECNIVAKSLGDFFEQLNPEHPPVLLLMDIELSDTVNSIDHLKKIKALIPSSKIIIITGHNHPEYILRAIQNGADGFYLKGSGILKLREAIESTTKGGVYLSPDAVKHLVPVLKDTEPRPEPETVIQEEPPQIKMLTRRERQIAKGLTDGASYKELGINHNISINTVRHYVKILYKKFDVDNKVAFTNKVKPYL